MTFFIRKIFSVFISVFLFFSTASAPGFDVRDDESLQMSAVVLSDIHMEGNNTDRFNTIGKLFKGVGSGYAVDALCLCGDQTMNSQWIEWFDFYGMMNRYIKNTEIIEAFGNHDFGNTNDHESYVTLSERALECYRGYAGGTAENVYYSVIVKGYRFIVMGSEDNMENTVQHISDEQVEWLKGELKKCADEGIPAIVLNHNLLYGKNGSRSYYSFNQTDNNAAIVSALENAGTKVIYICGHSHFGVNSGSVNTEGDVTYINLPSAGNNGNYDPDTEEWGDAGIGMLIEAYPDTMELTFINFITGDTVSDKIIIDK